MKLQVVGTVAGKRSHPWGPNDKGKSGVLEFVSFEPISSTERPLEIMVNKEDIGGYVTGEIVYVVVDVTVEGNYLRIKAILPPSSVSVQE